jgi:hypothetical protein
MFLGRENKEKRAGSDEKHPSTQASDGFLKGMDHTMN